MNRQPTCKKQCAKCAPDAEQTTIELLKKNPTDLHGYLHNQQILLALVINCLEKINRTLQAPAAKLA